MLIHLKRIRNTLDVLTWHHLLLLFCTISELPALLFASWPRKLETPSGSRFKTQPKEQESPEEPNLHYDEDGDGDAWHHGRNKSSQSPGRSTPHLVKVRVMPRIQKVKVIEYRKWKWCKDKAVYWIWDWLTRYPTAMPRLNAKPVVFRKVPLE